MSKFDKLFTEGQDADLQSSEEDGITQEVQESTQVVEEPEFVEDANKAPAAESEEALPQPEEETEPQQEPIAEDPEPSDKLEDASSVVTENNDKDSNVRVATTGRFNLVDPDSLVRIPSNSINSEGVLAPLTGWLQCQIDAEVICVIELQE